VEVATFGKILGKFLAHSFTFRCWGSLASFQTWGTPGGGSWNVLITGPPSWEFDVPLAIIVEQAITTRVAVLIEEEDDCLLSWFQSKQDNRQSSKNNTKYQLLCTYVCTS